MKLLNGSWWTKCILPELVRFPFSCALRSQRFKCCSASLIVHWALAIWRRSLFCSSIKSTRRVFSQRRCTSAVRVWFASHLGVHNRFFFFGNFTEKVVYTSFMRFRKMHEFLVVLMMNHLKVNNCTVSNGTLPAGLSVAVNVLSW